MSKNSKWKTTLLFYKPSLIPRAQCQQKLKYIYWLTGESERSQEERFENDHWLPNTFWTWDESWKEILIASKTWKYSSRYFYRVINVPYKMLETRSNKYMIF